MGIDTDRRWIKVTGARPDFGRSRAPTIALMDVSALVKDTGVEFHGSGAGSEFAVTVVADTHEAGGRAWAQPDGLANSGSISRDRAFAKMLLDGGGADCQYGACSLGTICTVAMLSRRRHIGIGDEWSGKLGHASMELSGR